MTREIGQSNADHLHGRAQVDGQPSTMPSNGLARSGKQVNSTLKGSAPGRGSIRLIE